MPDRPISKTRFLFVAMFFLPFFLFYWMAPFVSKYTLGNDYCFYPIQNQMYLLFSIKTGSFPLFIPGFSLGHSSAALTLGQIFHPFPHIAAMLPGYWQGQALEWNTCLRLLSLGLSHCLLFTFLTKLNLTKTASFLISFITVYNLRMLDLFRYGASLEAYTAHLMLISALGLWHLQSEEQKRCPFLIVIFSYMLVVSGHPQMMYFAFMATALFILILPFYATMMRPGQQSCIKKAAVFWGKAGILCGSGVLLASVYSIPYYFDFILTNSTRVGRDFSWADSYLDTWLGSLGNFFSPLISNMAGAFGASSLISMAVLIPILAAFRTRVPKTIWVIWGFMISVFFCMQGGRTPLYPLFWKYVPFADSFRVPGRTSFFMPMLIMLLLAWLVNAHKISPEKTKYPPIKILALTALLITALFNAFIFRQLGPTPDDVSPEFSNSLFVFGLKDHVLAQSDILLIYLITTWAGVLLLLLLFLFYDQDSRRSQKIIPLLCLLSVLQVMLVLRHGTYYRVKRPTLTFEEALKQNRVQLSYFYYPGFGLASAQVSSHLKQSFREPNLAKIYKEVIWVSNRGQVYERMKKGMAPQTVFVEKPARLTTPPLPAENIHEEGGRIHLDYSSYNRLRFTAQTPSPCFFGLAYPYSDYWEARVNGQKAATYRINGLYLGLALPQGRSQIDFRYFSPPAFWGMVFSCAGLFLVGSFFCVSSLTGLTRITALMCVTVLSLSTFKTWQSSLYTGENIETAYDWVYTPPSGRFNKAYGKPVTVNASFPEFHAMSMVDGDSRPNSGFISKFHKEPALRLDLQETTVIKQMVLFESGNRPAGIPNISQLGLFIDQIAKYINIRPIVIDISQDGQTWQTIATITQAKRAGEPLILTLEPPAQARHVRIKCQKNVLGFDEIEIY